MMLTPLLRKRPGEKEALVYEKGTLKGIPVVACAFEVPTSSQAPMGSVVGASTLLTLKSVLKRWCFILLLHLYPGGARMQKFLISFNANG